MKFIHFQLKSPGGSVVKENLANESLRSGGYWIDNRREWQHDSSDESNQLSQRVAMKSKTKGYQRRESSPDESHRFLSFLFSLSFQETEEYFWEFMEVNGVFHVVVNRVVVDWAEHDCGNNVNGDWDLEEKGMEVGV